MWEIIQLALTSEPVDSVRQDYGTDIFGRRSLNGGETWDSQEKLLSGDVTPSKDPEDLTPYLFLF